MRFEHLHNTFLAHVWEVDPGSLPPWRARLVHALRVSFLVGRDVADGQLNLMAMSLVYTTLLSLVPLLAVSFSVLKAFGVHNQIEPLLLNMLAPLGQQGIELTNRIVGFVENINVGVLGSVGLAFLFYTVVTLIQKIEESFNYTWRIEQQRSLGRRFSDYLSVIIIGPVLVFSAIGITASLMNTALVQGVIAIEPLGEAIGLLGKLLPYVLIVAAFTFIYMFVPNTRVRLRAALTGGLVAGVLWQTVGWAFAAFVVGSSNYTAIYSAFAVLVLFMIWVYVSWLILLVGADIAFYTQHREYLTLQRRGRRLSNRAREALALLLMQQIVRRYYQQQRPWTLDALAKTLQLPLESVESVMHVLLDRALLVRTDADPPSYVPNRPPETTPVMEVLSAVRTADSAGAFEFAVLPRHPQVNGLLDELDRALTRAVEGRTLRDLALAEPVALPSERAAL